MSSLFHREEHLTLERPSDPLSRKQRAELPNINERIRFPKIRLIDTDGKQLGIMSPKEALRLAEEKDLDLVLVSDKADPPVCRIMDYGKFKFEKEKKEREARKKQHIAEIKEVKFRYNIGEHDYNVRLRSAQQFMADGDKVKATVMLRGREAQHAELGEELLRRLFEDLKEVAEMQQAPRKEGRNITMILSPKKA